MLWGYIMKQIWRGACAPVSHAVLWRYDSVTSLLTQYDRWLAAFWPYHWHAGQSSLAAFFWAHPVQASDDGVSATARSRPTVLIRWPSSLGGYPVAATSAVGVFAAARRAAHSSSDWWRPSVRCCRSDDLEQSAARHYWLCVTDIILPKSENFFVLYIISMTTFFFLVVSGHWDFYLGHFKIFLYMYVQLYTVCMYRYLRSWDYCPAGDMVIALMGLNTRVERKYTNHNNWLCNMHAGLKVT